MSDNTQLEAYLSALDKALGQIPVGDRSEIITEIKSHIMDAQERSPEASLSSILASIGEPETVANRYLLERGLKPNRPSKSPMIKWLVIGFLGTFAIACFTLVAIIWNFTPLISVDEETDRVVLFGGAIDIDGATEMVRVGNISINGDMYIREIEGEFKFTEGQIEELVVDYKNGKFDIKTVAENTLSWKCKLAGDQEPAFGQVGKIYEFRFEPTEGVKCELAVPKSLKQRIKGLNGKLKIEKPENDLEVVLVNGKVGVEPMRDLDYIYNIRVQNGKVSGLNTKEGLTKGILVNVSVTNGKIYEM